MTFTIATNPDTYGKDWTSPLWWNGDSVVGPLRAGEAVSFEDREAALAALDDIPHPTRRFYSLAVVKLTGRT